GQRDWPLFLSYFKNLLLGFCEMGPTETSRSLTWVFWSAMLAVLVLGAVRLVRDKRWGRLILVGGLLVTVCGVHPGAGGDAIRPKLWRYGLFLVVPFVLAFSCLVEPMLVAPSTVGKIAVRRLQFGVLIAAGFALLFVFKQSYFDSCSRHMP